MEATTVARPEIVFFDVETTVPTRIDDGCALLEFGAIVVCPNRLVEVGSYSTLIRPTDVGAISALFDRCNGISRDAIANAPPFRDVADAIYGILNGRIWAGHNIVEFDCVRIREAFAELGRPAPEPKGLIDTLPLLTQRFGKRSGDMKMASLANYFGLGHQKHRSLDDVRMNLEVVKCCATVLFLETSLPDMFPLLNSEQTNMEQMKIDSLERDATVFALSTFKSFEMLYESDASCSGYGRFFEPDELSPQQITAPVVFSHQYGRKITLLHKDCPLQICSMGMAVHFGVRPKFNDHAGRPKLSIVVDISDSLSKVLDICDQLAQRTSQSSGSISEWKPLIRRSNDYSKPSIRLHIPIVANGDAALYSTEMYQKDPSGNVQKLVFSKVDVAELDSLFTPGAMVDAYFGLEVYDFLQNAGIKTMAKKLVVHARQ